MRVRLPGKEKGPRHTAACACEIVQEHEGIFKLGLGRKETGGWCKQARARQHFSFVLVLVLGVVTLAV